MSAFRLAALLRLRTMQEDAARAGLGRARQGLASAEAATAASRQAVRVAGPAPSGSAAVFLAAAASRAALAVAVSDSIVLEQTAGVQVETSRAGWQAARSRSRAVARLEDKHQEQQRIDLARREQAESDELASARWRGTEQTNE
jgi:flagellar FliJ protein